MYIHRERDTHMYTCEGESERETERELKVVVLHYIVILFVILLRKLHVVLFTSSLIVTTILYFLNPHIKQPRLRHHTRMWSVCTLCASTRPEEESYMLSWSIAFLIPLR